MPERKYAWLQGIMDAQRDFETERVGTDGSLWDYNTPEHILERGVIGEAQEALEAVTDGVLMEVKVEAVDVLIFLSSLFNHLDMTAEDVERLAHVKMDHNTRKYRTEFFEDRTVQEAMQFSRDNYASNGRS